MLPLHGLTGRITAGIAALAGTLTALTEAAQQANLFTIVPEKYRFLLPLITVVTLFLTLFSERVQGGASNPEVREAAKKVDDKAALDQLNNSQ